MITAYDCVSGQLAQEAAMDMVLVGDSLGMVVMGESNTVSVTMEQVSLGSSLLELTNRR